MMYDNYSSILFPFFFFSQLSLILFFILFEFFRNSCFIVIFCIDFSRCDIIESNYLIIDAIILLLSEILVGARHSLRLLSNFLSNISTIIMGNFIISYNG